MDQVEYVTIIDQDGARGTAEIEHFAGDSRIRVQFDNSRQVLVPKNVLTLQEDGSYYMPLRVSDLEERSDASETNESLVIPILEEELHVGKRQVETGKIRITRTVQEQDEIIDLPLLEETFEVTRVPVNRVVEGPISVRYEGDTVIVPLVEEVVVVQKQLVLREEVHLTKKRAEARKPKRVTVRSEEAHVERIELPQDDSSTEAT